MIDLSLLPEPAHIELAPGSHEIDGSVTILLSAAAERGEWVTAQQVQATLAARGVQTSIQPREQPADTCRTIVLAVAERDENSFANLTHGGRSRAETREAYRLSIEQDRIVVAGTSPAGVAQGARTLVQLLQAADPLPCLTIEDAPALPWRGVLLDISRGKVPTLETLRRIVDVIASFKLNMLQLYMENTFAFRSHPQIGAGWGALTPEEVVALDAYCRVRYVELVPCIQSLGHHRRLLSLSDYARLSYSPEDWTLAPGEETWQLLGELYDDLLPCFTSRYVNVCCDEPYDLTHAETAGDATVGLPTRNADTPGMQLYLRHVQKLHDMLRTRGRTMMVWDDVFQRAPELLAEMPADVLFLPWCYAPQREYPQVETIHNAGRQSMVCPGTSSWNTLWARNDAARTNIRGFVRAGLAAGSIGVLTTDWGDNGHVNPLGASWYGYAYGGSEGWAPGRLADDEFERRFAQLFFRDTQGAEALRLIDAAVRTAGTNRADVSGTWLMFFGDPIQDADVSLIPDHAIEHMEDLATRALGVLTPLQRVEADGQQTLAEMRLAARQIVHAARKMRAGQRLAVTTQDDRQGRSELYTELEGLKRELHELRWEYQRLWLARNRPEGIWLSLDHFDRAAQLLDRWRSAVAPPYHYRQ